MGVVLAIVIGSLVGTNSLKDIDYSVGEDGRAQHILAEHGYVDTASENVLIQRATPAADAQTLLADPQIRATLTDAAARIRASGVATALRSPVAAPGVTADPGLVSHDRRSVLLTFDLKGSDDDHASVDPTLDAVAAVRAAHPGLSVEQFGDASADKALNATVGKDFHRAELLALPLTLGILLAVFGAVIAALVPMALAMTAFIASIGLVAFVSRAFPTDSTATSVMLLIGLAVGVDYALFYIRREREERAAGHGPERALEIAAETSGHAVLTSGLTVAASLAGLFITGMGAFTGVAVGTIIVVLIAVLGSLTALPALLSMLGDRVEMLRLPWRRRTATSRRARRGRRARHGEVDATTVTVPVLDPREELLQRRRAYQAHLAKPGLMGRLLRRPGLVAAVTGGLLLLLTLPTLGMHTAEQGFDDIPKKLPIMKTYERLSAAFPGGQVAAHVIVSTTDGSAVTTPQATQAIQALRDRALATGRMYDPIDVTFTPDHQVARVSIPITGSGTNGESISALKTLRSTVIPATIGADSNLRADVTGTTAGSADFNQRLKTRTPLVIAFVMVLAFGLLLGAFRSALIALVAVGLNLLSVGASYGLLVAVFQHHWADGLLGYTSTGAVTNWLPLMLFVILFGLSMDYQVFVLSRVKEARDAGLSMRDAVTVGVRRSAGVVTSAAVIMVAVFSIFATLSQVSMKQLGVGLGAAILIDATLIRVVLMPAVLTLLGDRLWRGPRSGSERDSERDDDAQAELPHQPAAAEGRSGGFPARPADEWRREGAVQMARPRPDYPTPRWALPPN
ncbi:MMPL family transporter [Frankia sp. AgB32]|uniref:MMPL family transporter n=1 Tax=Frankia sp. AgB32 TaxID=631119 RepID=UPI00200E6E0C|nr:MMPL family transporter [Frankia sp. AgB32]MCK9894304.1 MMPL family transporter [Frankia sp. AgB32]